MVKLQNVSEKTRDRGFVCGWKEVEQGWAGFSDRANRNVLHICECSQAQDETEYGSGVTDWRRRERAVPHVKPAS